MIAASNKSNSSRNDLVTDPPVAQALFDDVRWSWIWLIIRLYVGYEWLLAGWDQVINPAWVGARAGTVLQGFINSYLASTTCAHPAVQGWYAAFLKFAILPG